MTIRQSRLIMEFMVCWNKINPTNKIEVWRTTEKSLILFLDDGNKKIIPLKEIF